MEKCRWEFIANRSDTGCTTPFMQVGSYPECSEFERATKVMEMYQVWSDPKTKEQCRPICMESCKMQIYTAQVMSILSENFSQPLTVVDHTDLTGDQDQEDGG